MRAWLNAEGVLEIAVNTDWPRHKRQPLAHGVAKAIMCVLGQDVVQGFQALNAENPATH